MKPIPIRAAEKIAQDYGYEQVVIIARKTGEDGSEHVTTYGINRVHCAIAAKMEDALKKFMRWPDSRSRCIAVITLKQTLYVIALMSALISASIIQTNEFLAGILYGVALTTSLMLVYGILNRD
jgi:hypothetical protein